MSNIHPDLIKNSGKYLMKKSNLKIKLIKYLVIRKI
jgi:hypothetical protein